MNITMSLRAFVTVSLVLGPLIMILDLNVSTILGSLAFIARRAFAVFG
jgi:hypothetical protein